MIYKIAKAVRQAAQELGVSMVWGGAWDVTFTSTTETPEEVVEGYVERRKAKGRKAFIDGPHYELIKK